jgi:hypothetical protein
VELLPDGCPQLGAGVVSAGGYYYLQRTSPDTIKKVEAKVEDKLEQGKAKATQLGGAATAAVSGTPNASNGALDPSKFTTFKLKAVEVGLPLPSGSCVGTWLMLSTITTR